MIEETELKMADAVYQNRNKGVTIRFGNRVFADQLKIVNVDHLEQTCEAIAGFQQHLPFWEIPFKVFLADGFDNFLDAIVSMQEFYPNLTYDSEMTILWYYLV